MPYLENLISKCFIWEIILRNTRREGRKWNRERSWPINGMFLSRLQLLAARAPIPLRSPGSQCKICLRDMLSWRYLPSNSTSHWPRTTSKGPSCLSTPSVPYSQAKCKKKLCMESHMCAAQSREWMGIEMVSSKIQAGHQQCLLCPIPIRLDSECQYIYHLTKKSGKKGKLPWYVRECCT